LGLSLTFFGFSALRCAMVHDLQISFKIKITTVKQNGKGRAEARPTINIRENTAFPHAKYGNQCIYFAG